MFPFTLNCKGELWTTERREEFLFMKYICVNARDEPRASTSWDESSWTFDTNHRLFSEWSGVDKRSMFSLLNNEMKKRGLDHAVVLWPAHRQGKHSS